ncbi:protein-export chaperone SecB [Hirschia litorea]|uniref:Protein-export protein SecB n=1 Tax=Hirschia litorea TaxID=1199156 RepID=A0ABW2IMH5_9PROT
MNDTPTPEGQPVKDPAQTSVESGPSISVLAQYIKDLSFENPNPLSAGAGQNAPAIELGIDVKADPQPQQPGVFEVNLRLSAQAKREDKVVFIAELVYAGLFELKNAQQNDVEPLLLIECPRLLFPFARRVMAEVTREGGYPPLLIDPIDFIGLYRAQRQQAAAAAAGQNAGETPPSEQA